MYIRLCIQSVYIRWPAHTCDIYGIIYPST